MSNDSAKQHDLHIRGRFAPSPSGRMHLGNVFCALLSWLITKHSGGMWVLRIEDLDRQRCKSDYAAWIEDDLHWLGLEWDEGGKAGGDNYFQSHRSTIYETFFQKLCDLSLTYPCFCTRTDLWAAQAPHTGQSHIYNGHCRTLTTEERIALLTIRRPAIRVMVPDETICFNDRHYGHQHMNLANDCGDFIVRRSDGTFAYQLAVVVDDAQMHINQVVRGRDLLPSTAAQLYLYRLLQLPEPQFFHLPLLCTSDGKRLCKRDHDLDLSVLRTKYSAAEIIGQLAFCAGQTDNPHPITPTELLPTFDPQRIPTHDIIVGINT